MILVILLLALSIGVNIICVSQIIYLHKVIHKLEIRLMDAILDSFRGGL